MQFFCRITLFSVLCLGTSTVLLGRVALSFGSRSFGVSELAHLLHSVFWMCVALTCFVLRGVFVFICESCTCR